MRLTRLRFAVYTMTLIGSSLDVAHTRAEDAKASDSPGKTGRLIVYAFDSSVVDVTKRFQGVLSVDPETGKWLQVGDRDLGGGVLSPDHRFLAGARFIDAKGSRNDGTWVYDLSGDFAPRKVAEVRGDPVRWVNGGKQLLIGVSAGRGDPHATYRVNADGSGLTKLEIPGTEVFIDCTRDGTWLATYEFQREGVGGMERHERIRLVRQDGSESHIILDLKSEMFECLRFSPDGRKVLYSLMSKDVRGVKSALWVANLDGKERKLLPLDFEPGTRIRPFWSPDGSRLAISLRKFRVLGGSQLAVTNLDGSNLRSLALGGWTLRLDDWN